MARKVPVPWIVVADGARARFFTPHESGRKFAAAGPGNLVAPKSRQRPRDLKSDKPGRGFASAGSSGRHAFEPPHDYHKLEKHRFMVVLAEALDEACAAKAFDTLVLVLPRRSLGELRPLLSRRVASRVTLEIAKDLSTQTMTALWKQLSSKLNVAAA